MTIANGIYLWEREGSKATPIEVEGNWVFVFGDDRELPLSKYEGGTFTPLIALTPVLIETLRGAIRGDLNNIVAALTWLGVEPSATDASELAHAEPRKLRAGDVGESGAIATNSEA